MFNGHKVEIAKVQAKKELQLAMIEKSSEATLRSVTTDSNVKAIVQMAGIKSVTQEEKGWYYKDPERDTLLIKYLDDSWERLDMKVSDFTSQTGFKAGEA